VSESAIQDLAEQFVRRELSTVDLHRRLSARHRPIADQLEADLWGVVFEVGDGDLDIEDARRWLTDTYDLRPTIGARASALWTIDLLINRHLGFPATFSSPPIPVEIRTFTPSPGNPNLQRFVASGALTKSSAMQSWRDVDADGEKQLRQRGCAPRQIDPGNATASDLHLHVRGHGRPVGEEKRPHMHAVFEEIFWPVTGDAR
jgi:hypothetical protein